MGLWGKFCIWVIGWPMWKLAWVLWKFSKWIQKKCWQMWDVSYSVREHFGIYSRPNPYKLMDTSGGGGSEGNGTHFP